MTQSDWRVKKLARLRQIIKEADPEAVEEMKWKKPSNPKGTPTFYHNGIVCTVGPLKTAVRVTFVKGSLLKDPAGIYNANLKGKTRAIDFREADKINEGALKGLIREAVVLNSKGKK